ncbi:MAG: LLM class flavin-dependent oxidoreductase [Alphaproteobacteria bacterium]
MFELGLAIDGFTPASDIPAQACAAEEGGAQTLWIATHLFQRDSVALAATALAATKTLKLSLMAISPYAMHPTHAAMAAATLDELYPGRVVLSLGVGAPADLRGAGIESTRPLATMREAISICRALLSGETVTHEGEIFHVSNRRLVNPTENVPIVLAASGPRMLSLSGSHADGVIVSGATSAPFVTGCLERVAAGAQDRKVKNCGIVYTHIEGVARVAQNPVRRTLGFILRGEHHAENVRLGGAGLDQQALREAFALEDWATVDRLISDEVLAAHAACGDADTVRARFAEYSAAGLDHLIVSGIADPEDIVRTLKVLSPAT